MVCTWIWHQDLGSHYVEREREREREGRREDRGLSYGDYVMKRVRKVDIYIKREMKQINNHTRKEMEKEKKVKACLASV
jgi:hypothetical protein